MKDRQEQALLKVLDRENGKTYIIGHWMHLMNQHLTTNLRVTNVKYLSKLLLKWNNTTIVFEREVWSHNDQVIRSYKITKVQNE